MDAQEIKRIVAENAETIAKEIAPNGKVKNNQFLLGDSQGSSGESLKLTLTGSSKGLWYDHAEGRGGHLLDLWASVKGITWADALEDARRRFGICEVKRFKPRSAPKGYNRGSSLASCSKSSVHRYLNNRGIGDETLKTYKIRKHPQKEAIAFQYETPEGEDSHVKYIALERNAKGKKVVWTTTPTHATLWGWWLVDKNTKEIIITEGEIDAMSVHQMEPGIPVLSLPFGTGDDGWIENDYEKLQQFEKIYLVTDADDAGDDYIKKAVNRLGMQRACRVRVPGDYKDPNEAWNGGDEEWLDWENWKKGIEHFEPETILTPTSLINEAKEIVAKARQASIRNNFIFPQFPFAYRDGEVTIVSGEPGHGKSLFLYQSHLHEMVEGNRVFICSMEIPPAKMLTKLAHNAFGHMPEYGEIEKIAEWLSGKLVYHTGNSPKDHEKTVSVEELLFDMEYSVKRYGINRFVIDSLHFLVGKDDYKAQDEFVRQLRRFADRTNTHVALVAHSNIKQRNDAIPGRRDVEGSGGIIKPIDNGITIWRNEKKQERLDEGDREAATLHDALFMVWKQRETGKHFAGKLWFDTFSETLRDRMDGDRHFFKDIEWEYRQ